MKLFPVDRGQARWPLALAALLLLSLLARLASLESDAPLDAARDLSLTTDGSWYTGAALDWATGREGVGSGRGRFRGSGCSDYDPPAYGWLARGTFLIFGPARWTANLTGVLSALLAIGLTAAAARRAHGPEAGLAAGALLSLSYPFFIYSRAPGIYLPAAAVAAAALYLEARAEAGSKGRDLVFKFSAVLLALAGAWAVKPILLLNGLAFLLCEGARWWRRGHPRRRLFLGAGLCIAGLGAAFLWQSRFFAPQAHKIEEYLEAGGGLARLPYRLLTLEIRLSFSALAPALAGLFVLGALFHPRRRLDEAALATAAVYLAVLALLGYSPIRYLLPAFPAMALVAGRAVQALFLERPPAARQPLSPWKRWGRGTLLAYAALQALLAAGGAIDAAALLPPGLDLRLAVYGAAAAAFGAAAEIALGKTVSIRTARWQPLAGGLLLAVLLLPELLRGGRALAQPENSIILAGEEVKKILSPSAHLTGPFAHVLTDEAPQRRTYLPLLHFGKGRLERELRRTGASHLAVDAGEDFRALIEIFKKNGVPLRLVHEFFLRRQKVHLYRLPWADEIAPASEFERGVEALQAGNLRAAERHLGEAVRLYPDSSAASSALGAVLLQAGRSAEAAPLLERALLLNPYEASALRTLIRILLERGDLPRARSLLEKLTALDGADAEAARLLEKISRR
ncbi:MAG: glycosyltransferase family 39 protein [Planctomycetes bacterium]|nr:glycosyltransferase family 39 protein [Planctomycetota bacterium]